MTPPSFLETLPIVAVAAGVLALAVYILWRGHRGVRRGALVSADVGAESTTLYSGRFRLYGRPDEVRQLPGGSFVPVEFKSRAAPIGGVPRSHRVQLGAYCLLVEETFHLRPPYGILRYAGGVEIEVAYDDALRAEVIAVRRSVKEPYDGRATPSAARCRRCPWCPGCDAAVA